MTLQGDPLSHDDSTPSDPPERSAASTPSVRTGSGEAGAAQPLVADKSEPSTTTYSPSGHLLERLSSLGISLAMTSYQSGLLYMLGRSFQGGLHLHQCAMPKPMGVCFEESGQHGGSLTLAGGFQIMRLENVLAASEQINHMYDRCYVPRTVHVTGQLDAHDVGIDRDGRAIFVNTRYNCLATTDVRHSFRELWRPPFISELIDEDRCHLNGLAMDEGRPAFVSAVSRSNTIDGWRDRRSEGGVVVDVRKDRIVCEGLSMPHSPRLHRGELWILNAGTGELGVIEGAAEGKGKFVPRVFCPGFLRGLAFRGNYAFVGLSKPRYERFEGLALDRRLRETDSEPWCGVQIIDLDKGSCVDWFRIDGAVAELYDIEIIPGAVCPMAVSPHSAEIANLITHAATAKASGKATDGAKPSAAPAAAAGPGEKSSKKPSRTGN